MDVWEEDERGFMSLVDSNTGTRYRLEKGTAREGSGVQLAVYAGGAKSTYDRTPFPDPVSAIQHVYLRIHHDREETLLGRVKGATNVRTPWGRARSRTCFSSGIDLLSTAETDGFYVNPALNLQIPESLRITDGWYQEDTDGARVALAFPELFTTFELIKARETAIQEFGDAYEAFLEKDVEPPAPAFR